ncbi:MAG TPA: nuclease [Syntrophobacteraceae bacterium]|nr:nuclease [Syntrophobacteraceae bacterium]HBZ54210.1 nuclease [Syntrophobacteraceae bacterium]
MLWLRTFLILLCLSVPCPLLGWEGKIISVSNGDLMTVLHEGREERLRLYGVDTPDEPQDFGKEARELTSQRVLGKAVEVMPVTQDRHGNTVAIVSLGGIALNRELAGSGLAWVYSGDCIRPECKEWKEVETEARNRKIGLWSTANPIPPWDFRRSGGNALPTSEGKMTGKDAPVDVVVYHGNIVSRVYHAPGCSEYNCKTCIADFKGRAKAERAGYKPCPACNP